MAETELLVRIRAKSDELSQEIKRAQKDLAGFGTVMNTMGGNAQTAGKLLTAGLTVPILAGGAAAVAAGLKFDDALDKIRTESGKTGADLKALEIDFREVFTTVPASAEDASTAIAELSQRTDLTGTALQHLARQMLELSRLTGTDLSANVRGVTRVFGDWSIATEKQSAAADFLFRVHQQTGIGVEQLTDQIVQMGAPLRAAGFSFQEAAVLMGAFEQQGVVTEKVQSGLNLALRAFAKAGIDAKTGFNATVDAIRNAKTPMEATGIAMKVFGTKAATDMAIAIREGRFEMDDLVASIAGGEDTILGAAEDTKGFSEGMIILKNQVTAAIEPIGTDLLKAVEDLIPVFADAILKLASAVRWFTELPDPVKKTTGAFIAFLAVIGPSLIVLGKVATGLREILIVLQVGKYAATVNTAAAANRNFMASLVGGTAGQALIGAGIAFQMKDELRKSADELDVMADKLRAKNLGIQSQMQTIAGTPAGPAVRELSEHVLELAESFGLSEGEAAQLAAQMEATGLSAEELLEKLDLTEKELTEAQKAAKAQAEELKNLSAEMGRLAEMAGLGERDQLALTLAHLGASESVKAEALANFDLAQAREGAAAKSKQQQAALQQTKKALKEQVAELVKVIGSTKEYVATLKTIDAATESNIDLIGAGVDALAVSGEAWDQVTATITEDVQEITAETQRMAEDSRRAMLRFLDSISGGFAGGLKNIFDDLKSVFPESEILKSVGGFGEKLVAMAGPGGAIFGAVAGIANIFGIDLMGMISKVMDRLGEVIAEGWEKATDFLRGEAKPATRIQKLELLPADWEAEALKMAQAGKTDAEKESLFDEALDAMIAAIFAGVSLEDFKKLIDLAAQFDLQLMDLIRAMKQGMTVEGLESALRIAESFGLAQIDSAKKLIVALLAAGETPAEIVGMFADFMREQASSGLTREAFFARELQEFKWGEEAEKIVKEWGLEQIDAAKKFVASLLEAGFTQEEIWAELAKVLAQASDLVLKTDEELEAFFAGLTPPELPSGITRPPHGTPTFDVAAGATAFGDLSANLHAIQMETAGVRESIESQAWMPQTFEAKFVIDNRMIIDGREFARLQNEYTLPMLRTEMGPTNQR